MCELKIVILNKIIIIKYIEYPLFVINVSLKKKNYNFIRILSDCGRVKYLVIIENNFEESPI